MASKAWILAADLTAFMGGLKDVDATAQGNAINYAAGRVNMALRAQGITPSVINSTDYPDDDQFLVDLVTQGAAVYYTWITTGSATPVSFMSDAFKAGLEMIEKQPSFLDSYAITDGADGVTTHRTGQATDVTSAGVNRMRDPGKDVCGWETF